MTNQPVWLQSLVLKLGMADTACWPSKITSASRSKINFNYLQ
jgi:hypothetical protein